MHIYTHAWDHQEAAMALTKYQEITDKCTRENFIKRFESSGSGKSAGSLKWTINFQKTLTSTDTTEIGSTEDMITRHAACMSFFLCMSIYIFAKSRHAWMPLFLLSMQRPRILQLNGLCMQDLESTEAAFQTADRLFEKNKEEFGHAGNMDLDNEDPMLSKYQYVHSHGKKDLGARLRQKNWKVMLI